LHLDKWCGKEARAKPLKMLTLDLHVWQNIWELTRLRRGRRELLLWFLALTGAIRCGIGVPTKALGPCTNMRWKQAWHLSIRCALYMASVVAPDYSTREGFSRRFWDVVCTGPVLCAMEWCTELFYQSAYFGAVWGLECTRPILCEP